MCQERRFQPMFRVRFDQSPPFIQMYSHILRRDGRTHNIESMTITNWVEKDNKSCVYWTGTTPLSPLKMSDSMMDRFIPRYCTSDKRCCLCLPKSSKAGAKPRSQNCCIKKNGIVVKQADRPGTKQYKCKYNKPDDTKQRKKITYPNTTQNYIKVKDKPSERNMKAGYEEHKLNVYDR